MGINLSGLLSGASSAFVGASEGLERRRRREQEALDDLLAKRLIESQIQGTEGLQQNRVRAADLARDKFQANQTLANQKAAGEKELADYYRAKYPDLQNASDKMAIHLGEEREKHDRAKDMVTFREQAKPPKAPDEPNFGPLRSEFTRQLRSRAEQRGQELTASIDLDSEDALSQLLSAENPALSRPDSMLALDNTFRMFPELGENVTGRFRESIFPPQVPATPHPEHPGQRIMSPADTSTDLDELLRRLEQQKADTLAQIRKLSGR